MGLFDFFSKIKPVYTPSAYFLNHDLKDKYFFRKMRFYYLNEEVGIVAMDNKAPRLITFDPWPQQIFLHATGKITTHDFLIEMASLYRGKVPERLDKTIIEEFERLIKEEIVDITDEPNKINPEYLTHIKYNK
jgi:hypothetical protein